MSRNNRLKRILTIILILLMLFCIAGCSAKEQPTPEEAAPIELPVPEPVPIASTVTESYTLEYVGSDDKLYSMDDFKGTVKGSVEIEWEDSERKNGVMSYTVLVDQNLYSATGEIKYLKPVEGYEGYTFVSDSDPSQTDYCMLGLTNGIEYFHFSQSGSDLVYLFRED